MSDTISRTAAVDAVNKIAPVNTEYDCTLLDILDVRYVLTELPSAEPEIIRCRDCKHWDTTWQNDFAPNYHYCPLVDGTRRDDFYCADAERRGGERE